MGAPAIPPVPDDRLRHVGIMSDETDEIEDIETDPVLYYTDTGEIIPEPAEDSARRRLPLDP
jgi:hypothetical protein